MASRPVFTPTLEKPPYVREVPIEFQWHAGFAITQVQKSIESLHAGAAQYGIAPVLEISSKSADPLGVALSAFNLALSVDQTSMPVECAFQGSKVYSNGGPYTDLYQSTSREAKRDPRLVQSGRLVGFQFGPVEFPLQPTTAFYDWLYLRALIQNPEYCQKVIAYQGFSDIAFNPKRSLNCQARSAAHFVGMYRSGIQIDKAIEDRDEYLKIVYGATIPRSGSASAKYVQARLVD